MIFLLLGSTPYQLFSQPSSCPEYSICIEVDPSDCNQLSVSINGLVGDSIAALTFLIEAPDGLNINVSATTTSFFNASIGMHFLPSSIGMLQVTEEYVRVMYTAVDSNSAYVPTEECTFIGNIVFDSVEIDCINFDSLVVGLTPLFDGPLHLGPDFSNRISCDNYTLDCPCSSDCPEDWSFFLLPHPDDCGRVQVYIVNAGGIDLSGFRFQINLEPGIVIDSAQSHSSFANSDVGSHSWNLDELIVSGNQVTLQTVNTIGDPYEVQSDIEFLFDIVYDRQDCVSFEDSIVSLGETTQIIVGHPLTEAEFCVNDQLGSSGFTVCCEEVLLSGYVKRPSPDGPECIEGVSWGFPSGKVVVEGLSFSFSTGVSTDEDGYYELIVPANETYRITPSYTQDHSELCDGNVNVLDIAEIRRVILDTIPCFSNDYSPIAADLNLDKTIDTLDLAHLSSWILQIGPPPSGNWQFMPKSQYIAKFANQSCPWLIVENYTEYKDVALGFYDEEDVDFVAIKMGDVDTNMTCVQCIEVDSLTGGIVKMSIKYDAENSEYQLFFDSNISYNSIEGLMLRIESDLEFSHYSLSDRFSNLGWQILEELNDDGGIAIGWVSDGKGIEFGKFSEKPILSLGSKFSANSRIELIVGEILIDNKVFSLELDLEISIDESRESVISNDFEWIEIFPNPGVDMVNIKFNGKYPQVYNVEIINTKGELLQSRTIDASQFDNQSTDTSILPAGLYFFRISSEEISQTLKWIKK